MAHGGVTRNGVSRSVELLKHESIDFKHHIIKMISENDLGMIRGARGCKRANDSMAWWCELT